MKTETRVIKYQKEAVLKCADVIYSTHEFMDIGEAIDNEVLSAIAMMYIDPTFSRVKYIGEDGTSDIFYQNGITDEELRSAFWCVAGIYSSGNVIKGYSGFHEELPRDRICLQYEDGSVLVHWLFENKGRNMEDYEFFMNMEEFEDAFGKPLTV